jgi:uncharacterized protein (TIRG00374 family)
MTSPNGRVDRLRRLLPWPVRRAAQLAVIAVVAEYLLLPQLAGARASVHLLGGAELPWFGAAFVAEVASLAAFTYGTRVLLPRDGRPSIGRLLRIDLSTIALSHAVPGGAAAGTALGYRLLNATGVPRPVAAFAKLSQGVTSTIVLQLMLWSALALAIPLHGGSPLYITASIFGAVLIVVVVAFVAGVHWAEPALATVAGWVTARLPRMTGDSGHRFVHTLATQVRVVTTRPRLLFEASAWAVSNWLFDAACLWCCLRAFDVPLGYDALIFTFCLANIAAYVPLTPSGLGVVEGVTVPLLVGVGTPHGIAILAVLAWRLLNFWLPVPVGAAAYLTLSSVDRTPDGVAVTRAGTTRRPYADQRRR